LIEQFFAATGEAPDPEKLRSVLRLLEAKAKFAGPERSVFVRIGEQDGRIYLDLADKAWRAIEIPLLTLTFFAIRTAER
jgi:hypothetical protein